MDRFPGQDVKSAHHERATGALDEFRDAMHAHSDPSRTEDEINEAKDQAMIASLEAVVHSLLFLGCPEPRDEIGLQPPQDEIGVRP